MDLRNWSFLLVLLFGSVSNFFGLKNEQELQFDVHFIPILSDPLRSSEVSLSV